MVTEQDTDFSKVEVEVVNEDYPTSIWNQLKFENDVETSATTSIMSKGGGCFFNWELLFPELRLLKDNIDIIKQEIQNIPQVISKKLHSSFISTNDSTNFQVGSLARGSFQDIKRL